jgi:hypothetical protein
MKIQILNVITLSLPCGQYYQRLLEVGSIAVPEKIVEAPD